MDRNDCRNRMIVKKMRMKIKKKKKEEIIERS